MRLTKELMKKTRDALEDSLEEIVEELIDEREPLEAVTCIPSCDTSTMGW